MHEEILNKEKELETNYILVERLSNTSFIPENLITDDESCLY
jgi:hypothetical protein